MDRIASARWASAIRSLADRIRLGDAEVIAPARPELRHGMLCVGIGQGAAGIFERV